MILQRTLYPDIERHLSHKEFSIITGARQVGKTSLLRLLFSELTSRHKKAFYLSLEDPTVLAEIDSHPDKILNFLTARPKPILEAQQPEPRNPTWQNTSIETAIFYFC